MRRRFSKSDVKYRGLTPGLHLKLLNLSAGEESGIPSVAVKCVDIRRNTSGEGGFLDCNRIRYPGSPRRKRWILGVGGIDPPCAGVNTISIPPGEYGRKAETQRN